jgi:hypothetical protein
MRADWREAGDRRGGEPRTRWVTLGGLFGWASTETPIEAPLLPPRAKLARSRFLWIDTRGPHALLVFPPTSVKADPTRDAL